MATAYRLWHHGAAASVWGDCAKVVEVTYTSGGVKVRRWKAPVNETFWVSIPVPVTAADSAGSNAVRVSQALARLALDTVNGARLVRLELRCDDTARGAFTYEPGDKENKATLATQLLLEKSLTAFSPTGGVSVNLQFRWTLAADAQIRVYSAGLQIEEV